MRNLLTLLIALHGLIHFLGFFKAFGLAQLPALTQPISRLRGVLWLAAGLLLLLTALLHLLRWPVWPGLALLSALLSQLAIAGSWKDARAGTVLNLLLVALALNAWLGLV